MKKFFSVMLLCATVVLSFTACSDDEEMTNSLQGTLWSFDDKVTVFEESEFTRYIEFTDGRNVKIWDTDGNGPYSGTYTVNGNAVTFHNLHDRYWRRYYIDGVFSTRSLTVNFSYDEAHENIYDETYTKE